MEKKCTQCKIVKPYKEFSILSRAKDGLNYRCKSCCSAYYNNLYAKIKENKIQKSKAYYYDNKEKILLKRKKDYNSVEKKIYNKIYFTLNKSEIKNKKLDYERNKMRTDLNYRLIKIMRKMILRLITNKKECTFDLLGYSKEELLNYLKRPPNINEEIDHKIPVSWFVKDAPIYIISHLKNLQILSKETNRNKRNKYADLIDEDYYQIAINFIKENYKTKIKHYGNITTSNTLEASNRP